MAEYCHHAATCNLPVKQLDKVYLLVLGSQDRGFNITERCHKACDKIQSTDGDDLVSMLIINTEKWHLVLFELCDFGEFFNICMVYT